MDPATAAVMVLLWCSPDMLFCRRPPTEAPDTIFSTASHCEDALQVRLATAKAATRIVVGRCQAVGSTTNRGASPSRQLPTLLEPDRPPAAALQVDAATTGSTPSVEEADSKYTTVRVTYGTGNDAVTIAYVVERSN